MESAGLLEFGCGLFGMRGGPAPDKADALADITHRVIPVIFVFDTDIAIELLVFELLEHGSDIGDARAENDIMLPGSERGTILHMHANNTAGENLHAVEGHHAGGLPMPNVRAGANARITVFHEFSDEFRVPDFIVGIRCIPAMLMVADPDVVFLHQFVDRVDGIDGFRGDSVEFHLLSELKNFAGASFVLGDTHHTVIHRTHFVLGQLLFDLGHHLVAGVMVPFRAGHVGGNALSREELDHLAASLFGLFDGFEDSEAIEGVGLGANGKPTDLGILRNGCGVCQRTGAGNEECGRSEGSCSPQGLEIVHGETGALTLAEVSEFALERGLLDLFGEFDAQLQELRGIRVRFAFGVDSEYRFRARSAKHEPSAIFRDELDAIERFDVFELRFQ